MTSVNDHLLRPLLPFYAAGPFLLNTPLFYSSAKNNEKNKNRTKIFTMREKKKLNCGETVLFFCFFPFCLLAFLFYGKLFLPFVRFFVLLLDLCLR